MSFGRNTAAVMPERARGSDWGRGCWPNRPPGRSAAGSDRRLSPGGPGGGGASHRLMVARAGYANARFAVAQTAQDSNLGADTAGNLVNVG